MKRRIDSPAGGNEAAGMMDQVRHAATPEAMKADHWVQLQAAPDGAMVLSCGGAALSINPATLQIAAFRNGVKFALRPPESAVVRLPDGRDCPFRLQDAGRRQTATEQWAGIRGIAIHLSEFHLPGGHPGPEVVLFAGLDYVSGDAVFELRAREDRCALREASWPGAFDGGDIDAAILPHTQGLMIPRHWPKVIDSPYADDGKIAHCYSIAFYMPWWGVTRGGHSAMMVIDTPDDAGMRLFHDPDEGTTISPKWLHSMGKMDYPRRARLKILEGNYVAMAKAYRQIARENGTLRTTAAKIAQTPALARLIGAPIIHTGAYQYDARKHADAYLNRYDELAEKLTRLHDELGFDRAYLHLDGIGYRGYDNLEPDQLPVGPKAGGADGLRRFLECAHALGCLVAYHQQFRDMYLDAPSYDEGLLLLREDGTRHIEDSWAGGRNALMCATRAMDYIKRNNAFLAAAGLAPDGCYLDVFSAVSGDECYHPAHRMSRTACLRHRRECFEYIRQNVGIVSSEEAADWAIRSLHLVHHTTWAVDANYDNFAITLPLFALVYHDALIVPFETGRQRGSYYYTKNDLPFLHALISAGMPYLPIDATAEDAAAVKIAAELHGRAALSEMIGHQLLDPDGRRQRATYEGAIIVTTDQNTGDWEIAYPDKVLRGNAVKWRVTVSQSQS